MKNRKERKKLFVFSKFLTMLCLCQFFYVFYMCSKIVVTLNDYSPITFYTAIVGVSGSLAISCIIWYMKKSSSEKGSQFQVQNLKEILELKANPKYSSSAECMDLLNNAEQDAISRATNLTNTLVDEANQSPEVQTNIFG